MLLQFQGYFLLRMTGLLRTDFLVLYLLALDMLTHLIE